MSENRGGLTDIPGLLVGHYTDRDGATGLTVVIHRPLDPNRNIPSGAVGGVDVRGSAPGTRETDLLRPGNLVERVNAVVLTGGSAFGLASADGVMRYLEEQGLGFPTVNALVPIVPAAVLYDLGIGRADVRPDRDAGYQACLAASSDPIEEGSVGAGTGATVGKLLGPSGATKGGIGTHSLRLSSGVIVAALVAVNALGDVHDPETGEIIAGARDGGGFVGAERLLIGQNGGQNSAEASNLAGSNTTIGVVATNALLSKEGANKLAQMAQDGLARAIRPAHTMFDGDTLFSLATGEVSVPAERLSEIGAAGAYCVAQAIKRAILAASTLAGVPSSRELHDARG